MRNEVDNNMKWKNFITFYIDPIKQRFKEGLLSPNNNNEFNFNSYDKMDYKPFEQQEKEIELQEKPVEEEIQKKIPMKEFLKQSSLDYFQGKKIETIENKKVEMEILHDEVEDNYNTFMNDIVVHPHVLNNYEKNQTENHEFYDNNYWASNNLIVDEVELDELTQSL